MRRVPRNLPLVVALILTAGGLGWVFGRYSKGGPVELRPPPPTSTPRPTVEIRTVPALTPLATNAALITLHGSAVDDETGEVIPDATFTITTTNGVASFQGEYTVTVAGMSEITYYVAAPGYEPAAFAIRPHYARTLSISAPVPLTRSEPPQ